MGRELKAPQERTCGSQFPFSVAEAPPLNPDSGWEGVEKSVHSLESGEKINCAAAQVFTHSCQKRRPGLDSSPQVPPRDELSEWCRA